MGTYGALAGSIGQGRAARKPVTQTWGEHPSQNARLGSASTRSLPAFVKRIAVCVSGEFRHDHHRTPEQQLRHLLAFITGVDCDVFVHGWHNSAEPLILHELAPRAYRFDPRPSLHALVRRIRFVEPNIKPGRDEGSLAMFQSLQQCFALVAPFADEYSHVLRIRPDLFVDYSLLEILGQIEAAGAVAGAIYVPHMFHSKGINDQIAFGPIDAMRIYCDTLTHVIGSIDREFFGPETALLRNLVAHGVPIAFAHIPYALMRAVPIRINTVHERFHSQFGTWWSRTEWLPTHQDLSAYFRHKLRAVDDLMRKRVPPLLHHGVPASVDGSRRVVLRTRAIDHDPVVVTDCLVRRADGWTVRPYRIRSSAIDLDGTPDPRRHSFVLREPGGYLISEWHLADGALRNERLAIPARNRIMARTARAWTDGMLKFQMWRDRIAGR